MDAIYTVFVRSWYKSDGRGGLIPQAGRKTIMARGLSYSAAVDYCRVYNLNHNPGRLSRKCEFMSE